MLANTSELVIMRAAGMSTWRILFSIEAGSFGGGDRVGARGVRRHIWSKLLKTKVDCAVR